MHEAINMSDYSSVENLLRIFERNFTEAFLADYPNLDPPVDNLFSSFVRETEIKEREYGGFSDYTGIITVKCFTAPEIIDYYKLSMCSFIIAKRYYEKNELLKAAGYLSEAYRNLGIAEGMNINNAMYKAAQKFITGRKKSGEKGGKAKAQIYTKLIPTVSKLLAEKTPTNGWTSKSEAADTLSPLLAKRKKFPDVINENEVDRIERARNWIYKWLTTKGSPLYLEFENGRKTED